MWLGPAGSLGRTKEGCKTTFWPGAFGYEVRFENLGGKVFGEKRTTNLEGQSSTPTRVGQRIASRILPGRVDCQFFSKIGLKFIQNRSQNCPKSCPKRSAAINGRPKRQKVVWINVAQRFFQIMSDFWGSFGSQKS